MIAPAAEQTGRRRVLDAAAELFVSQGYAGTTLRQIAASAGIKAGSIYHHFDSKEDLFVATLDDGIAVMSEAFAAADGPTVARDGVTSAGAVATAAVRERLLAHVRAHLGAVFENGPYTTAHVTSFFTAPPEVRRQVVPRRDSYEKQWSELLAALLPDMNSTQRRLHRLILFGAMNATVEWFDPSGATSLDDLAAAITDQFLTGVLT